jgi:RNA polymerase sigma-70 factor (ECF subfamily)
VTTELLYVVAANQPAEAPPATREATLVAEARAGDREAFGTLYNLYAPMVHGILLARVPFAEVDDLMQDVFLLAFRKINALRDANAFGGWLAMIARNCAIAFHRRRQTCEELTEDAVSAKTVDADSHATEILDAIHALPEAYRETLILRLVEGMTGPEIAARTDLTPDSVRVNLHRGIKMLRAKLRQGGGNR